MLHENQTLHHTRRLSHLHYLDAGLVAGPAAFSSLAGVLFAGFASFLASALAGAEAGVAGALAGSAAKADTANAVAKIAISLFMIFPLRLILN